MLQSELRMSLFLKKVTKEEGLARQCGALPGRQGDAHEGPWTVYVHTLNVKLKQNKTKQKMTENVSQRDICPGPVRERRFKPSAEAW